MADEQNGNNHAKGVALVGHCGPDSWMLKSMIKRTLPDAEVFNVDSVKELEKMMGRTKVLLVNRVLGRGLGTKSGIELIRDLSAREDSVPAAILISNYDDAQAEAEAAGALPGFGKSDLNSPTAAARLKEAYGV